MVVPKFLFLSHKNFEKITIVLDTISLYGIVDFTFLREIGFPVDEIEYYEKKWKKHAGDSMTNFLKNSKIEIRLLFFL